VKDHWWSARQGKARQVLGVTKREGLPSRALGTQFRNYTDRKSPDRVPKRLSQRRTPIGKGGAKYSSWRKVSHGRNGSAEPVQHKRSTDQVRIKEKRKGIHMYRQSMIEGRKKTGGTDVELERWGRVVGARSWEKKASERGGTWKWGKGDGGRKGLPRGKEGRRTHGESRDDKASEKGRKKKGDKVDSGGILENNKERSRAFLFRRRDGGKSEKAWNGASSVDGERALGKKLSVGGRRQNKDPRRPYRGGSAVG